MTSMLGGPPLLTDSDVDGLACKFLSSAYADNNLYSDWSLDRRLEGFLRRRGLVRFVQDGDAYDLILDRVMAHIGGAPSGDDHRGQSRRTPPSGSLQSQWAAGSGCSDGHRQ